MAFVFCYNMASVIPSVQSTKYAGMVKLAYTLDLGSNGREAVQVQVLLPAPKNGAQPFRGCAPFFLVSVQDLNHFKLLLH